MNNIIDTIVIGSGPAGLSATLYASRAGLNVRVFTGSDKGGMLLSTEEIDNYLGLPGSTGKDLASKFVSHAKNYGAIFYEESIKEIEKRNNCFVVTSNSGIEYESKSIIYALGSTPLKLGIIGEESENVSYCATCDGMFYQDDKVIVIGGGETASEDALYLANLCEEVTLLVRGDKLKATQSTMDEVLTHKKINVKFNTTIDSMNVDNDLVESVVLNTGEVLETDGIFVCIGQNPNSGVAGDFVELRENSQFIGKSLVPGFFVAGDVKNPEYRQVAIAVGEGAVAGIDATKYINTLS